ncbi:MLO-like protein 11 [Lactuca sativa]|uniref:MLO-like protein 11 n=1 Tax=Lactuca sativa TaxID=4236 RepID=UPI0022AE972A|nr:MLO-like protein 11 [Lactuca sativa]
MSSDDAKEDSRSLALTPTCSIAIVMTIFVLVSLLVEESIRYLSNWLKKMKRKPMLAAVEKMKEGNCYIFIIIIIIIIIM